MNSKSSEKFTTHGKRASHVKWEGRTIALGTFSSAQEAADKCDQAKALTKKWRATMLPRPSVEWVKATLERLNIRVVNDRPGRRKKRTIDEVDQNRGSTSNSSTSTTNSRYTSPKVRRGINSTANHFVGNYRQNPNPSYQRALDYEMNTSFSFGGGMTGRSIDRRLSDSTQYGLPSLDGMTTNQINVVSPLPNLGNTTYNLNNATLGFDSSPPILNYQQNDLISNGLAANLAAFGHNQEYELLKEQHWNILKELQETNTLIHMYRSKNIQNNIMDSLINQEISM